MYKIIDIFNNTYNIESDFLSILTQTFFSMILTRIKNIESIDIKNNNEIL